ncbi:MAG: hypothetical protein LBR21_09965 [Propionibacteriaceae bacterium]|jgi:chaperonin cofactor prefoldin|nr:hypothetical protein [Propionibacteriaceae bacterium]
MADEKKLEELVKSLTDRIRDLEIQVRTLKGKTDQIPEEHLTMIAAAVAAYLGYEGEPRQPHFNAPKAKAAR